MSDTEQWEWEYHPHRKEKRIALVARDRDVILATGDNEESWLIISEKDARLIESLPDLLGACQMALSVGECLERPDNENQRIYLGKTTIVVLRAAIAKATRQE